MNLELSLIAVQAANHRFMFPARVIEQRHDIADDQAQYPAQMS
jgi:hypothetical protein